MLVKKEVNPREGQTQGSPPETLEILDFVLIKRAAFLPQGGLMRGQDIQYRTQGTVGV